MPHLTAFIDRWNAVSGSERANYQLFLTELCELLDWMKQASRSPAGMASARKSIP